MFPRLFCCLIGSLLVASVSTRSAISQMINVETPFTTASDSFFENFGVNFGFQIAGGGTAGGRSRVVGLLPGGQISPNGNLVFSQNSAGSAIPQFGGYDPNTSATFGYINSTGNGSGYSLGFDLSSGSTRTLTSQAPNVTVFNGQSGTVNSNQLRPFVTGIIPVVGLGTPNGYQPVRNWGVTPVYPRTNRFAEMLNASDAWRSVSQARAQNRKSIEHNTADQKSSNVSTASYSNSNSSANYGDLSVAEIKRQRQAKIDAEKQELHSIIAKARSLEAEGKYGAARYQYNRAVRRASGDLKKQLKDHYNSLKNKR